ncbi:UMP kinase [Candidatus Pacearchaeota archaeon]|nr:UMP kinase [Candidatus Pacearchaeota archaeon]
MEKVKKIVVLRLGGSLIVPNEIDFEFLEKFKSAIEKLKARHKFVVVCGGGSIARKYIKALKEKGLSQKIQSMAGIAVTRLNARFMTYFFGRDANQGIPHDMGQVEGLLRKHDVVFCGALRYAPQETSDGTAAKLANFFRADFINLTAVPGLYTKNPAEHKDARFIPEISWKEFYKRAVKIKYKPGQHFILDQHAARIIMKRKIKTYIIGKELKNFENVLKGKRFKGTLIDK